MNLLACMFMLNLLLRPWKLNEPLNDAGRLFAAGSLSLSVSQEALDPFAFHQVIGFPTLNHVRPKTR